MNTLTCITVTHTWARDCCRAWTSFIFQSLARRTAIYRWWIITNSMSCPCSSTTRLCTL